MPSRNTIKEFAPNSYYHVYNRGVEKRDIFLDDQDYAVFLGLLKKYLTGEKSAYDKKNRHNVISLESKVNLLAYCLLPNHFHLLLYQTDTDGVTQLLSRVSTGYVMYFNHRHNRVGGLFQSRYKASNIDKDAYLEHISRYIHLNPDQYKSWPYSSLSNYQGTKKTKWLNTSHILDLFESKQEYSDFVDDYEANKKELDLLKWQLANDPETEA